MFCGYIYKIQFPNGKHYIGLTTTSLNQRTNEHKSCARKGDVRILYNALRKYDMVDTLELTQVDTADTIEELREKEITHIKEYNSYMDEKGYNMTYGGEGVNGYVFSQEVKEHMSKTRKKYFKDNPEAGKEHSEKMKKYYEDNPEAREQQSEKKKKYYEDNPEAGKEHSERMKKHYEDNPEARRKLSRQQQHNPFDVFKKDGTFIKTFTYQFEAKEYLQTEYKITSTFKIGEVLAGNRNSSAGFVFKYK